MEGDYLAKDGIHRKRNQLILDGTEDWKKDDDTDGKTDYFYLPPIEGLNKDTVDKVICSHFVKGSYTIQGFWVTTRLIITINKSVTGITASDSTVERITKFKNWLAKQYANGTPVVVEYDLEKEVVEPYIENVSNFIVQYNGETTISNSDNTEMEVGLTKNKAISSINGNISDLQEKDNDLNNRIDKVNTNLNGKITNLTTYSTEEIKIGETWIDGKPIYRKTFIGSGAGDIDITSLKIDEIFFDLRRTKFYWSNVERHAPLPLVATASGDSVITGTYQAGIYTDSSKTKLTIEKGGRIEMSKYVITIEYTKTTD